MKARMHVGAVWCSVLYNDLIITGARDSTVRVWDIKSAVCVHALFHHKAFVQCMLIHNHKLYTGGMDGMIYVYDADDHFKKM